MKQANSLQGVIIFLIIFITLEYFLPFYPSSEEAKLLLTIATFLFGIFGGFVIASRLSRYSRYRELLTNETGFLISFHNYSKLVDDSFSKKIANSIDRYLVQIFLYEVYEYHEKTDKQFYNIFQELSLYKSKNSQQDSALGVMRSMFSHMPFDREELFLLGKDKISFLLKSVLWILSGVILFCLFYLRTNEMFSYILTVLISTCVILVLFLMDDLDKLRIADRAMSYDIYYRVFDAIGKLRLYTNESIKNRRSKPLKGEDYRYGVIDRKRGKVYYKEISVKKG